MLGYVVPTLVYGSHAWILNRTQEKAWICANMDQEMDKGQQKDI